MFSFTLGKLQSRPQARGLKPLDTSNHHHHRHRHHHHRHHHLHRCFVSISLIPCRKLRQRTAECNEAPRARRRRPTAKPTERLSVFWWFWIVKACQSVGGDVCSTRQTLQACCNLDDEVCLCVCVCLCVFICLFATTLSKTMMQLMHELGVTLQGQNSWTYIVPTCRDGAYNDVNSASRFFLDKSSTP